MMGKRGIRGAEQNQHGGKKGSKLNFHQRCLLRGRGPRNKLYVALFKLLAGASSVNPITLPSAAKGAYCGRAFRYAVSVWCSAGVTGAPSFTMRSMIEPQLSAVAGFVVAIARS